jgi:hypothetical protein
LMSMSRSGNDYLCNASLNRGDRDAWLRISTGGWERREIDLGGAAVIPSKCERIVSWSEIW